VTVADLPDGILRHRQFARRSVKPYAVRLANAEHYAVLGTETGLVIEPLAWSLYAATGDQHELASKAPTVSAPKLGLLQEAGWQRIEPGDQRFPVLWQALLDHCRHRGTHPSARTGRTAAEDRIFWVAPGTALQDGSPSV